MHYTSVGDPSGQLVICLHGLGGSTETFSPFLSSVPVSLHTVRIDFPGFGQSLPLQSPERISVAGLVDGVHEIIKSLQAAKASSEPVVFVGHSLGAVVALQYAAKNPNNTAGLFLLGPGRAAGHIPAAKTAMQSLAAAVRKDGISTAATKAAVTNFYDDTPGNVVDKALRKAVYDAVMESDQEGYAQTCEALVEESHKDPQYGKIMCPVMFVAGNKDLISPVLRSEDLAALVGGPAVVRIVESGHQPILQDPAGVDSAFRHFLNMINKQD